ncbi:MAG: hypothetical protein ACXWAC_10995 [Usitatibacter sp.]
MDPPTSVHQYSATLASWFGAAAGDVYNVFPDLGRFPAANPGFMA